MKYKKRILLILVANLVCSVVYAETVTIGDNATNSGYNVPYNNYWKYSTTQMLYSAQEIGRSGKISSIAFKVASSSSFATSELKVYLGHRSSTFSNTNDYVTYNNMILVYEGSPTLGQLKGWETILFNREEFTYNGTDNLVVVVSRKSNNSTNQIKYNCFYGEGYTLFRGSDNQPDYSDVANLSYNYTTLSYRPSIKIGFWTGNSPYNDGDIFTANTVEGLELTYKVISAANNTCQVGIGLTPSNKIKNAEKITIPQSVNGLTVTSIYRLAFTYCVSLKKVIIPNTVESIGEYAFSKCYNLASITLPSSLASVGNGVFENCTSLNNVTIPNSLTQIGQLMFSDCTNLTNITIPNTVTRISYNAFNGCTGLKSITIPNSIAEIKLGAFYDCKSLTSIVSYIEEPFPIDETVFQYDNNGINRPLSATLYVLPGTKSKYEATTGWNQLNTVESDIVEVNGLYYRFAKADDLNSELGANVFTANSEIAVVVAPPTGNMYYGDIVIPSTIAYRNKVYDVEGIEGQSFKNSSITSIRIPAKVKSIGDDAFNGCSSLTSVTVESTEPLAINSTCFSVKAGATLNVPKGCYGVYKTADVWKEFGNIIEPLHTNGDTFAASITAGSGTTDAVFKVIDATNKYVSVGRGVIDDSYETAIDDWTGGEVVILSTVTGYDGQTYLVKQISDGAFFGCFEITSIELPDGIITIGRDAFYQCARLTSFTIPATVATIGDGAFNGCNNITSINIPSNVTSLGTWAFAGCSKLTSVTVNRSEPLAIDDKCFTNAKNATLNVPKGAYKKYASAENWKNFKTIKEPAHSVGDTFAASVRANGSQVDATFKVTNTSGRYVSIGDAEDAAIDIFASGNVVIPSSVKGYDAQTYTVKAVSDAAFFGCENITSVSLPSGITGIGNSSFLRCYNLASINIPTNVTKIGTEAFFYCEKLTSISISKNVTSIGTRAFKNCSQLTSVTVNWATPITIDNECFSNAANATLNVPYGSKERYEAATGWKQFKNIVEMAPKDGDIFTALTTEGVKMTFTVINASAKTCKVGDGSSASISASTDGLVTIPTTANDFAVTQISSKAFYNCNQITATEIPICITSIGTYAFSGCNNLTSVTVGWDEPISISTNCFSNAANATLYVPIGRNKYYKAATGWKDFGLIANKTESRLFADDVIVCRGGQIILPINLSNEEAIRQVHFELSLPAGISVATGQQATLTQRANSTHIITANPLSNGNYEFNIMSKSITSDKTIEGTEGCIANIYLKVWKSTAPNDYGIGLTDCELSIDGTSSALLLSDSQSKLTVSNVMLGDTNDDERISVTDISNIIDYILHKQVDNFVLHAADVNGDGRLTVTDISTIIDIILHKVVFEETQATRKEELDQQ